MNIAIYQINPDRDENNVAFLNYENLERFQGSAELRSEIYDKVFEGKVDCGTLEEMYQMFNLDHPDGYRGRSLSVSDVIEVIGEEKSTFHFCDSIGFREVNFDPDMTEPLKEKEIKVVLCEPGKVARVAEIGTELSDLQRVVGGLIEPYYPFEEQVCIVCNDEGKYNGMRPCRAIYGEDREMMDINPACLISFSADPYCPHFQPMVECFWKGGDKMRIYACLLGNWVDITDTGTVADYQNPVTYFKENLQYSEGSRYAECFRYDYIHIQYQGKDYRINPAFIQIVTE